LPAELRLVTFFAPHSLEVSLRSMTQQLTMREAAAPLRRELEKIFADRESIEVLDAGCGSGLYIDFGPRARITGLDISEEALNRNSHVDEKIVGDIQTYRLPAGHYDVAVCWHVLEHLPEPERALRNLTRTVKDDGLIILGVPNLLSIKGLVTKFTPHRFHVWFYRRILGRKQAGREGRGPFRTFMRWSIAPSSIKRFAADNGFTVPFVQMYEAPLERQLRERHSAVNLAWRLLGAPLKAISFGKIEPELCNCIIVLKREAA
jgi:SAM-dependent methyltransferase